MADNPRYALLHNVGTSRVRAFDLERDVETDLPENIGANIFSDEATICTESGDVYFYHLGEKLPHAAASLPLDDLPVLRSASLSPSLDKLAMAIDGQGGLFRIDTGKRIANFPRFYAASFTEQATGFLLMHGPPLASQYALQLNTDSGATVPSWTGNEKVTIRCGGSALLEYSFHSTMGRGIMKISEHGVPFLLRALNPANGKELWKKTFDQDPPIPFADPQGKHLVLGWQAKTQGARGAASRSSAETRALFKKAKLGEHDSFFEALDADSGKSLGGVLVQAGSGPYSFESVFFEDGFLFLQKDIVRVSVYSLLDSQLKSHLIGERLAVNAQSHLLAVSEGAGRLNLYDLPSLTKLDQQLFSHDLGYLNFSEDGRRLFVLTEYQEAFLLDVSKLREPGNAVPEIGDKTGPPFSGFM